MDEDLQKLQSKISAVSAKNNWDAYCKTPCIGTYGLAALPYILPTVGPLKLGTNAGNGVRLRAFGDSFDGFAEWGAAAL